jgi:hypothetical protein
MAIIKVFKEAVSTHRLSLDLGSFESVMVSTTCKVHPQMFRRIFRTNIDDAGIKRFDVTYNPLLGISITAYSKTDAPYTTSSRMKFLPMPSREDTDLISKLVGPLWIDHNLSVSGNAPAIAEIIKFVMLASQTHSCHISVQHGSLIRRDYVLPQEITRPLMLH